MPEWLRALLAQDQTLAHEQEQPTVTPEEPQNVHGGNMAPIFQALAQYFAAQPQMQERRLQLAGDIGTGVSTSPHDMLYGQNASALYNPQHEQWWRRTFPQGGEQ